VVAVAVRRPGARPWGPALRARDERGVSVVEFALLTPVIVIVVFATVQFAMYFFARHVAIAAAQAGARTARIEADRNPGGWRADAQAKAMSYVRQLGPRLLEDAAATPVQQAGDIVGVRVTGRVPRILPLIPNVTVTSQGPVERFIPDQ
jgi:Flp pilus assembly protein TadG